MRLQVVASTSVACILFSSSTIGISGYVTALLQINTQSVAEGADECVERDDCGHDVAYCLPRVLPLASILFPKLSSLCTVQRIGQAWTVGGVCSRYLLGLLNTSYAEVIGPLAFVASLLGVTMLGKYVKKSGRSSIIVYILASIITLGKSSSPADVGSGCIA